MSMTGARTLGLAALVVLADSSCGTRTLSAPLSGVAELHGGRISFRQPDDSYTVLDLDAGAVLQRGNRPPNVWRVVTGCAVSLDGAACVLRSGTFEFLSDGSLTGQTEAGSWKSLYVPVRYTTPRTLYGIGDKLLIDFSDNTRTRLGPSALECVDSRSGRSLWMYVYAPRYDEPGRYFPAVAGYRTHDPFEDTRRAQAESYAFGVFPAAEAGMRTYGGKVVFDPAFAQAKEAVRRTILTGWLALVIVAAAARAAWLGARSAHMIVCLLVLVPLFLSFGYADRPLGAAIGLAFVATAAGGWAVSRKRGRLVVALIIIVTVTLWAFSVISDALIRT